MRGIFIMVTIVIVVAIVMYGIVQIKRGKVETPSQVGVTGPYEVEKTESETETETEQAEGEK